MKMMLLFCFITLITPARAERSCESPQMCYYTVDLGELKIEVPHTPVRSPCGPAFLDTSIKAAASSFGSRKYFAYMQTKMKLLKNEEERVALKRCLLSAGTRHYGDVDWVPGVFYKRVLELMEVKHFAQVTV